MEKTGHRRFPRRDTIPLHPFERPALFDLLRLVRFGNLSGHNNTPRLFSAAVRQSRIRGRRAQRVKSCFVFALFQC